MTKILYVEDHVLQRNVLVELLEISGFEVAVAEDGVEGVEKAITWLPDIILMDLQMPRLGGFKAIQQIRQSQAGATVPIIAMSAWADTTRLKQALAVGADDLIRKPVDMRQIITLINIHIK